MPPPPRVYVASPYGFSAATHGFYAGLLATLREHGLEPLDPWADPDGAVAAELARAAALDGVAEQRAAFAALSARLGDANADAIADPATRGVLAVLDGADVDSGVAAEVGFAAALGRPVVGIRFDVRPAGDNPGVVVNLQVQRFVERSGGAVRDAAGADPAAALRDAALLLRDLAHTKRT